MIRELIALDHSAKVWIYQADRTLSTEEVVDLRRDLHEFMKQWTCHSRELLTYGNIFHQRFLALFVDETMVKTSGCSIDSSVAFVRSMADKFNTDFFNRTTYAYFTDTEQKEIHFIEHTDMKNAYEKGTIDDETLFVDNLVKTKTDFLENWVKPLNKSWHYRFVK